MRFFVMQLRVFWAVAILLMAGGQIAHAYVDLGCPQNQSAEHRSDPADGDCPMSDCCCHGHLHSKLAMVDSVGELIPDSSASDFIDHAELAPDGLARDIDYPPQLS